MRGTTSVIVQTHQILRLPRKMTLQHFKEISGKQLKRHFKCGADPSTIVLGGGYNPAYTLGYNPCYNQDRITFPLSYLS